MKTTYKALAATALLALAGSVQAADADNGKQLYNANCQGCHSTDTHVGNNQSVKSLPALESRVRMCSQNLRKRLFDDELADIVAYLNRDFYKFK